MLTTSAPPSPRRLFVLYGQPLLLLLAIVTVVQNLAIALTHRAPDFAVFYASALAVRHGLDPYTQPLMQVMPNTNPPGFLLPLIPLTWLPERWAFLAWDLVSLLALAVSLRVIARTLELRPGILWLTVAAVGGAGVCLRLGQVSLILLPLMTFAWLADREGRSRAAGAWLGPLLYVKPFVGLYALYWLWRRDWRALVALTASWLACVLLGLLADLSVNVSWVRSLCGMSYMAPHVMNAAWLAIPSRLFAAARPQPDPHYATWIVAPHLATAVWLAGVLAIAAVSCVTIRRTADRDRHWAVLGAAMLLISPLGWIYYLPLLVPGVSAIVPKMSMRQLLMFGLGALLLWTPDSWLASAAFGPLGTLTTGSIYAWGLLLLWGSIQSPCREFSFRAVNSCA